MKILKCDNKLKNIVVYALYANATKFSNTNHMQNYRYFLYLNKKNSNNFLKNCFLNENQID